MLQVVEIRSRATTIRENLQLKLKSPNLFKDQI